MAIRDWREQYLSELLAISIVFLILAVAVQAYGMSCAVSSTRLNARAAQARVDLEDEATVQRMEAAAGLERRRATAFVAVGYLFAGIGVIASGFAFTRGELRWKLLAAALLALYILLVLIQV